MLLLTALLLAVAPVIGLEHLDEAGCGVVTVNAVRAEGAAPGLCVTQALWTPLEGGLVALLVRATHRFDARVRARVFLYRVEGRTLVPRFLGSGFRELEVERLFVDGASLGIEVGPRAERLSCRFEGFPLVCRWPSG